MNANLTRQHVTMFMLQHIAANSRAGSTNAAEWLYCGVEGRESDCTYHEQQSTCTRLLRVIASSSVFHGLWYYGYSHELCGEAK